MTTHHAASENGTIKGWHVLAAVLLFFGVIFAVNGAFLYAALMTHTGVVAKQPYRKGLDYNQRIAADAQQRQRGWSHTISVDGARAQIKVVLADRNNRPVAGLSLSGFLGRPSTQQHDVALQFSESSSPGTYVAKLDTIADGNWLVQAQASRLTSTGTEVVYRLRNRLWLKR